MVLAKCTRCGGSATGDTFEEAKLKINCAVGLSRGIKCGKNYGCIVEVKEPSKPKPKKDVKKETRKKEKPVKEVPKQEIKEIPKEEKIDSTPLSTQE